MKKIFATIMMALFFGAGISSTTLASKSIQCTVSTVENIVATLDCGDKAEKLTVGNEVTVKTAKKKAIEGC
jgi:hypothetical protein